MEQHWNFSPFGMGREDNRPELARGCKEEEEKKSRKKNASISLPVQSVSESIILSLPSLLPSFQSHDPEREAIIIIKGLERIPETILCLVLLACLL